MTQLHGPRGDLVRSRRCDHFCSRISLTNADCIVIEVTPASDTKSFSRRTDGSDRIGSDRRQQHRAGAQPSQAGRENESDPTSLGSAQSREPDGYPGRPWRRVSRLDLTDDQDREVAAGEPPAARRPVMPGWLGRLPLHLCLESPDAHKFGSQPGCRVRCTPAQNAEPDTCLAERPFVSSLS